MVGGLAVIGMPTAMQAKGHGEAVERGGEQAAEQNGHAGASLGPLTAPDERSQVTPILGGTPLRRTATPG
jgi:hypothetical protein